MHFWWEYQQQTKIIVKMIERWFSVNNFLSRLDLIYYFFVLSFFSYWHMWKEIFSRQDPIFNARSVEIFYLNCRTFACIIGQFSFFLSNLFTLWDPNFLKLHFELVKLYMYESKFKSDFKKTLIHYKWLLTYSQVSR